MLQNHSPVKAGACGISIRYMFHMIKTTHRRALMCNKIRQACQQRVCLSQLLLLAPLPPSSNSKKDVLLTVQLTVQMTGQLITCSWPNRPVHQKRITRCACTAA